MDRILAKPDQYLIDHVRDVLHSYDVLYDESDHLLSKLSIPYERKAFLCDVLALSIIFHDIGKANSYFLMALPPHKKLQPYRHEHISLIVLDYFLKSSIVEYFSSRYKLGELGYALCGYCIVHHHGKIKVISNGMSTYELCEVRSGSELISDAYFYGTSVDVIELCKLANERFNTSVFKCSGHWMIQLRDLITQSRIEDISKRFFYKDSLYAKLVWNNENMRSSRFGESCEYSTFILFLKCMLIFYDGVGSAHYRLKKRKGDICDTIGILHDQLNEPCVNELDTVLSRKIYSIVNSTGSFGYTGLQKYVNDSSIDDIGSKIVCLSDAGSGKSIVSHLFAKKFNQSYTLILLPTMDTATSAMEDYGMYGESTALLHSTSEHAMDLLKEKSNSDLDDSHDIDPELFSLGPYGKKVLYATYDQFISSVINSYNGIMLLPLLMRSCIIFDEPHSVEKRLFDAIITFTDTYHIPVMLTTASMPNDRRELLRTHNFNIIEPRLMVGDMFSEDRVQSNYKRYDICYMGEGKLAAVMDSIIEDYQDGKQLMIRFNCQESCVAFYYRIVRKLGLDESKYHEDILCYHGKCENGLKNERHQDVIDKSRKYRIEKKGLIVVTTSISEMALDIKMTVYTERCPLWTFMQVIGRCENRGKIGDDFIPSKITVFDTFNSGLRPRMDGGRGNRMDELMRSHLLPYNKDDVDECISRLGIRESNKLYSQGELADMISQVSTHSIETDTISLDHSKSMIDTKKSSLRTGKSVKGILDSRRSVYEALVRDGKHSEASKYEITFSVRDRRNSDNALPNGVEEVDQLESGIRIFRLTESICRYNDIVGLDTTSM